MKPTKKVTKHAHGLRDEYGDKHSAVTIHTKKGAELHHGGSFEIKHAKHFGLGDSIKALKSTFRRKN